jgi:HD-like signal output (HDOD) protein
MPINHWLARLFGSAVPSATTPSATAPSAPVESAHQAGDASAASDDRAADLAFWQWLARDNGGDAAPDARRRVLDELRQLSDHPLDAADLVPRVPEVIPRLLRSLRDEDVSGAELARQVAGDPVLVAEAIREANSPFYRPARPVRTIEAAVLLLGRNGLRMLLARVAFRPVIGSQSGPCARLAAPLVWRHAELCARAAALLAPGLDADPFEACLAGLMIDVGLVVALRLLDRLLDPPALPPDPDFGLALLHGARELSARIALAWELPAAVGAAILRAHDPDGFALAAALGQGDRLAKLRMLLDAGALAADDPQLATLAGPAARAFERLVAQDE